MVAFVDISTDARTLNIARTFANSGLKVAIIGLAQNDDVSDEYHDNITSYSITVSRFEKTWQRWLDFYRKSTIILSDFITKNVIAEDVYSLPTASECSKRNKAKLIYDSREIYSKIGPLSGRKWRQRIISLVEKRYIKRVNHIIVTGTRDEDYLKQNLTNRIPYSIIKNLPPYRTAMKSNKIRERFKIGENKKILLYQGMLLNGRGISEIIDAVSFMEDFVFAVIGDGPLLNNLKKQIEEKDLKDKVYLAGSVPYDELHEWTCSADIGIALIEPISKSYELALPNKLFEYIMAGIPTICSDLPAMKEIIDDYGVGKYLQFGQIKDKLPITAEQLIKERKDLAEKCTASAHSLSFESQNDITMGLLN